MEDETEAFDRNGQMIKVGDVVKYINTTTIGTVTEIMRDEEGVWALLDTTDLSYLTLMLELTDEKPPAKESGFGKNAEEDIQEKLRRREEAVSSFSGENIDGPGGAG